MTHLTLATMIRKRVQLAPREAAALTLAVAARWDRERADDAGVGLPDVSAIRLHDTGEVSFQDTSRGADGLTLSTLLGQLLGIDEPSAPRQPVPGGLLITIAGRLGQMELPSRTEDGFRTALARFADEDPAVLRKVFRRAARVCRSTRRRHDRGAMPHAPERRRQPPAITNLRREIRDLEQQVFEASERPEHTGPRTGWLTYLPWAAVVTVVAACAAASVFSATPARELASARAPLPVPAIAAPPDVMASQPVVASITPDIPRSLPAARSPRKKATAIAARRTTSTSPQARIARPVTFAGGARTISWLSPR